jgi:hypothetical protein
MGIAVDWRTHARVGIPVTLLTLAIAAAWLTLRMAITRTGSASPTLRSANEDSKGADVVRITG